VDDCIIDKAVEVKCEALAEGFVLLAILVWHDAEASAQFIRILHRVEVIGGEFVL